MQLSVVIPAYNEAHCIQKTLSEMLVFCAKQTWSCEIIVVDDGSTDDTTKLVQKIIASNDHKTQICLFTLPKNSGKGAALRVGIKNTNGEIIQLLDADLSYSLNYISNSMKQINNGADFVFGKRDIRKSYFFNRQIASVSFNFLVEKMLQFEFSDTQCGFKMCRGSIARQLFPKITINRFAYDIELIALAHAWNLRIKRIYVEMNVTNKSSVNLARDAPKMAIDLFRVWWRLHTKTYTK